MKVSTSAKRKLALALTMLSALTLAAADAVWTATGSGDVISSETHWSGGTAPDLTGGTVTALLSSGTQTGMIVDQNVYFHGLKVRMDTSGQTFTIRDGNTSNTGGNTIKVGAGGITDVTTVGRYAVIWPTLQFTTDCTIDCSGREQLYFYGQVTAADPSSPPTLTKTGIRPLFTGYNAKDSPFTGPIVVENGTLLIQGTADLGSSGTITLKNGGTLQLCKPGGVAVASVNPRPVVVDESCQADYPVSCNWWDSTSGTQSGLVTFHTVDSGFKVRYGSTFTVSGGVTNAVETDGDFLVSVANNAKLVASGKPWTLPHQTLCASSGCGALGLLTLGVAGNRFAALGHDAADGCWSQLPIRLEATRALDDASLPVNLGKRAVVDLYGTVQRIGRLKMAWADGVPAVITNSSATAATLHVTQTGTAEAQEGTFAGKLNLVKNGAADLILATPQPAVGDITVMEGGLTFTSAGSWTNCATLSVASGARCTVAAADTFGRAMLLRLGYTAQFVFDTGCAATQTVAAIWFGGVGQPAGLYSAQALAGVIQDTVHFAGDGVLEVLQSSESCPAADATSVTWTGGGGSSTVTTNAANWGGTLPDLAGGTVNAVFASGGSKASVVDKTYLNGLTFNSTVFDVEAETSGAMLRLGAGGMTVTAAADTSYKTIKLPVFIEADQVWQTAAGKYLITTGGLRADPFGTRRLTISAGSVYLNGQNADYGGSIIVTGGDLWTSGINPVGDAGLDGTGVLELAGGRLQLQRFVVGGVVHGAYLSKPVRVSANTANSGRIVVIGQHDATLAAAVTYSANPMFRVPSCPASLTFAGGVSGTVEAWLSMFGSNDTSGNRPRIVVTGKPWTSTGLIRSYDGSATAGGLYGEVVFAVAGNSFPQIGGSTYGPSVNTFWYNSDLRTTVDWAFDKSDMPLYFGNNSAFDLAGTSQRIGGLYLRHSGGRAPCVTNSAAAAATLYVNQTEETWTQMGTLAGNLNFVMGGTKAMTVTNAWSAVGNVTLNGGGIIFTETGSWRGATNIVVSGSATRFVLSASQTIGENAVLALTDGAHIELAAGVNQAVAGLSVDGRPVLRGRYTAARLPSALSGAGELFVCGKRGIGITFR